MMFSWKLLLLDIVVLSAFIGASYAASDSVVFSVLAAVCMFLYGKFWWQNGVDYMKEVFDQEVEELIDRTSRDEAN